MKKLNEMDNEFILHKVLNSKKLSEKFEDYVIENDLSYIDEKICCFPYGSISYSIGVYDRNYFDVKDNDLFLDGVLLSINRFGSTYELEKLANHCNKMRGNNLFEYLIKRLANLYYEQEIEPIIDYAEELSYAIYCKDTQKDGLIDMIEIFSESMIDDVYIEDDIICRNEIL